jgi:amino acid adenylation domain-containing protein
VSITFPQQRGYLHQEGGMVSPDGHCRTFDAEAGGTIFGSGAGLVLLKRLSEAVADGDRIVAVIRGCGVNNDGAGKIGYTAPSAEGQAQAIAMAHAAAGVTADSIGYVECHGTATPLGDPIEVAGLTQAFAGATRRQFCALGSIKTNIGHLDVAAGVAGLVKAAFAVERGILPPSLHFRAPNPRIDFASTPFFVNASLREWAGEGPRRAGVSAFGVGGTNVHVVLEQPPPAPAPEPPRPHELLVLSARDATALAQARAALAGHLAAADAPLGDVAFTLQTGRHGFAHRCAVVVADREAAVAALSVPPRIAGVAGDVGVAFMFPGQGAQYPAMGQGLYETQPVFRAAIDRCAGLLAPALDLRRLLYGGGDARALMATVAAQPAIFAVEYALAQVWLSWGVRPRAMIGHSIGEFVAACLAGVFSLEDALALVAERGRMMQALPGGAMLAVRLPEAELAALLPAGCDIAAVNAPSLCVAAGPEPAIAALEAKLIASGGMARRLHTSHAFHSSMMDPIVGAFTARVRAVALRGPDLPYVSCVTGGWVSEAETTSPDYWARHFRAPVRFADGLATILADGPPVLLEVGPGNTLATLARQGGARSVVASLPDAGRAQPDDAALLEALGRLWVAGVAPDWRAVHAPARRRRVALPTYRFQRARHWIDAAPPASPSPEPAIPMTATVPAVPEHVATIRAAIAGIFETLSGEDVAAADPAMSFLEMGFDSLFLSQVTQQLQSRFGVRITFRQLLGELSTLGALSEFVADAVPAAAPPALAPPALSPPALAPAAAAPPPAGDGIAAVMQAQLAAMSQLIAQQLHALGAAPQAAPAAAPPVPAVADKPAQPSRFQVYTPRQKSGGDAITPEQRRHIDALIARYTDRTAESKRQAQAYRSVMADPRAASGFRAEWKEMVYPIVCVRAHGSKIWDADGNEYIDLVNGYGQTAFGHAPDFVVDAVRAQLEDGFAIGPQTPLAGQVAELFCELTGNERVTFCNTGSEAVMAALRVARTVTGRQRVVMFTGAYHGQFDEVLVKGVGRGDTPRSVPVAPGIPAESVANMTVLDYATPASLEWVRTHAGELAAVIVESVQSRHPDLRPRDFLQALREITEASGAALIFDEVVTGFRMHPGGMQALFRIRADLATYGKVAGGGLPVGILAGRRRFMDALDGGDWRYGDESYPEVGVTFFAGTFVRHPLVMAATLAVLKHVRQAGAAETEALAARTRDLVAELNAHLTVCGLATRIETFGSLFYFSLTGEAPLGSLFYYYLRARGIHIQEGFPCFLTTAHSDADLDAIRDAFTATIDEMQAHGLLPGGQPKPPGDLRPTEAQQEIWLAAQLSEAASCAFNESVLLRLDGALDIQALARAANAVIARHDALRTSFSPVGDRLHIAPVLTLDLVAEDLSAAADPEAALQALVAEDAATPFDLVAGPLLRLRLLRLAARSWALMFTAHHIICDGWSINLVVTEIADLYAGRAAALPPVVPHSRYAAEEARRDPAAQARVEQFWLDQYRTLPAPLDLPTDRPRPARKSWRGATEVAHVDAALTRALKRAGGQAGATLFVTLLAAVQVLMGRLADQREVVIAVPTAGQSLVDGGSLVGHCVNFLPLRGAWEPQTGFASYLRATQTASLAAFEHQTTTFGTLVRKLGIPRDPNRLPLTSIQFNLERLADRLDFGGLAASLQPNPKSFVNFDLFFNIIESDAGLRIDCEYSTDLFDGATVARWLGHLRTLLAAVATDPDQPIARLKLLTEAERAAQSLAGPAMAFDREALVQTAFERQALRTPEAVAVVCGHVELTYAQLDARANRLARHLAARVREREARVGLLLDRSADLLVALLAVLKAGFTYVPLDPKFPDARLRAIAADADLALVIATGDSPDIGMAGRTLDLSLAATAIAREAGSAPAIAVPAHALAYVIYTSGSTGMPKGVEIPHRAVVNLLAAMARAPGMAADDVMLAVTTIAFDIAVLELLLPLSVGARVVIAPRAVATDAAALAHALAGATIMQATPATWSMLLQAGFASRPGLRMLCGGEALPADLASALLAGGGELWNMYGPTETTVWSAATRVTRGDQPIALDGPIANTRFHLLDSHGEPVAPGAIGELCIAGDGLARGYFRQPARTLEQFVEDPVAGGRMYRTGDLARRLDDGRIQILGRRDQQVKLRGFRVELGEIEAALARQPGVAACAAAVRADAAGHPRLVGYYVEADPAPTPGVLRERLAALLPDYMVPGIWVRLERLPATPNGKLDRRALPDPDWADHAARPGYAAPRGPLEARLAAVFAEVLQFDRVGIHDDLIGLGADSIHMFQITARAREAGIDLAARDLMQFPTVAGLAEALAQRQQAPAGLALRDAALLRQRRMLRDQTT